MADWTPIIVAVILALPSTASSILGFYTLRSSRSNSEKMDTHREQSISEHKQTALAVEEVREEVNGKMQQLVTATKQLAHAEGLEQGRREK